MNNSEILVFKQFSSSIQARTLILTNDNDETIILPGGYEDRGSFSSPLEITEPVNGS